jgi:soluble lytic murein transglycosylase-like protein
MTDPLRLTLLSALAAAALAATPARADVLEIDEAGNVTIHAAPRPAPASVSAATVASPAPLSPFFTAAADRTGVSVDLLEAVAWTESRFRVGAVSPKGARGPMQLMPATARMLGVTDIADPAQNIAGGAAYLQAMLREFDGDIVLALAAYNAGPGAVRRHRGVPPYTETRAYVERVLSRLAARADLPR